MIHALVGVEKNIKNAADFRNKKLKSPGSRYERVPQPREWTGEPAHRPTVERIALKHYSKLNLLEEK